MNFGSNFFECRKILLKVETMNTMIDPKNMILACSQMGSGRGKRTTSRLFNVPCKLGSCQNNGCLCSNNPQLPTKTILGLFGTEWLHSLKLI